MTTVRKRIRCDRSGNSIITRDGINYTYEQRLANNKKDFHQIWNNIFRNTPTVNTKLIIGTCNRRNATKEMVSKRPRIQPISKKKLQQKTNYKMFLFR